MREVCAHKVPHLPAGYPKGAEHRKDWEVAMAVRALDHFGALGPESIVLGVAAGVEDTLFYLTTRARQVFATDRYLQPGAWMPLAPPVMLAEPHALAPYPFDVNRPAALPGRHVRRDLLLGLDRALRRAPGRRVRRLRDGTGAEARRGALAVDGVPPDRTAGRHRLAGHDAAVLEGTPAPLHRRGQRPRAGGRDRHRRL